MQKSSSKFHIVPASVWAELKEVVPGISGTKYDESWIETDEIRMIREYGGIFVNDHFIPLWDIIRGILMLDGGYGSSKTTFVITRQLVKSMEHKYHRCYYGRQKKTEARNFHSNIITEIKRNGWEDRFEYSEKPTGSPQIVCKETGNRFDLFGCDDVDSLKGIDNPTDIVIDEVNQISFESFGMLLTRLRGQGYPTQLIGMFNNNDVYPDHWLKKFIYGDENSNDQKEQIIIEAMRKVHTVKHHSTYLHNLFQNPDEYLQKLIIKAGGDPDLIAAYCNGEWGVALNARPFYKMFNSKRDVYDAEMELIDGYQEYNPNLPLHVSWDENVNPYLPCIIAQISGTKVWIIDEIAAENPYNSLEWVCNKICNDYREHKSGMFVYGDATSKKEDVKLEKGKDFFVLAMEYLDMFRPTLRRQDKNPNVNMRGTFLNAIFSKNYERIVIRVSSKCRHLIEDLKGCPEATDGKGKDKTKQMINGVRGVQKWGHMTDCLDYLICEAFMYAYALFQSGGRTYEVRGGGRIVNNGISHNPIPKDLIYNKNETYDKGDIVVLHDGGVKFKSLIDNNIGNHPIHHMKSWKVVDGKTIEEEDDFDMIKYKRPTRNGYR